MARRGAYLQEEDYKLAVAMSLGYSGDFAAAYRADKQEFLLAKRKVGPRLALATHPVRGIRNLPGQICSTNAHLPGTAVAEGAPIIRAILLCVAL